MLQFVPFLVTVFVLITESALARPRRIADIADECDIP